MEEHGCELQLEHLEQFFLENKEPLEEIVKEFEQNYPETRELFFNSESQACPKFQNWVPSNQDEWGGGFPVNLKPLTQNDMEHFLRATHACQGKEDFNDKQQLHNVLHENNQIEDNFDNESLADSCLFFSNDGNKIFTCSFPEFASPRGSVLGRISHYDAMAPPHYEETPQFDKERNFIKDEPPQFPQEISLSSNVMRGNFKPRYPEPSVHYASGLSDVAMQELTRNQNQLAPPQFIDSDFFSKQNVLPEKDVSSLYSSLRQEGSRKRTHPPSPYGQTKQQQHVQPFSDDSNNHRNDDTKESFVNVRSSALPKHTINKVCTLSPPTFSSDTNLTFGTSSRESNSPGKSSITSPEQLDDFEQRSNVEWTPFKSKSWCKLFGADRKEVRFSKVQLNVDKGFNYSHMDDSFVCQRKNHFQVTFSFCLSNQPKFIEMENSLTPLSTTHLHFYGIKAESESHVVSIEQSESDRSKHHYQPVQINLNEIQPNIPVKVLVGRLHFGETTLNNMRKRGKPNPDQRYFKLVVNLGFSVPEGVNLNNTVEPHYTLLAYVSEKIIVRASNPNQFENDPESLWIKGKSGDSICHYGNVGINTKSPTEAMTVHGSVKITGQLLEPSDARIKTEIKEVSTKEQLQNINMINMYQYRYLPSYEEYAGLKNSHKYVDGSSPTDVPKVGILAQQVSHILPDAVQVVGEVVLPDGRILEGFLVVNKDRIFMEGIGAVKELSKVTQSLERRIDKIELNNKELTKFNKSIGKSVFSPKNKTKSNPSNTKVTGKAEKSKMSKKSNLSKAEMQSLPGQSGQEKLSSLLATLFRKRWKTIALATAISVALICSIIGMALGIKSTKNPTEPGRNPPPTNLTTTSKRPNATMSRPECTQNLSCVPSVSSFYSCPSVCGKGDTNEGATVTLAYIGDLCQSTTTDAPSTAAPNPNDIEYSSVAHDDNTVVQYSVAHDDGTASENGSQNKSYSNQPLFVTTPHTTFVTLGNDSTNSTRTKRGLKVMKRDAIFNTSLLITQIRLPEFNISLCTDTNLNFSLSKTFPQIDVLIQFSLVDGKDIALCGWKSTQWFGNNETHSPCFKEKTKEVYTWKLPIGHYKDLVFNFLVFNEKDAKDSCQKIADAQLGRSYSISFSRKCQ